MAEMGATKEAMMDKTNEIYKEFLEEVTGLIAEGDAMCIY